jgi:hypothetical protein
MKNKLEEIYESKIVHNSFLDKDSVIEAMTESYVLGLENRKKNTINLNWRSSLCWIIGVIMETTTLQEIIWRKCGERRLEYDIRKIYT